VVRRDRSAGGKREGAGDGHPPLFCYPVSARSGRLRARAAERGGRLRIDPRVNPVGLARSARAARRLRPLAAAPSAAGGGLACRAAAPPVQPVAVKLVVEGAEADAEDLGRSRLGGEASERLLDQPALHLVEAAEEEAAAARRTSTRLTQVQGQV